jgi:hypothetical protein
LDELLRLDRRASASEVASASHHRGFDDRRVRIDLTGCNLQLRNTVLDLRVGEAGTPCERMHLANASICACNCACCAGVGGVGARLRQERAAARNVGEFLSIPCVFIRLLLSGSGKFPTPWLRMHAEYAFGSAEPEAPDGPERCGPVVVPICATFASDEPPHPEANRVRPTAPTIASAKADRFVVRALVPTLVISSPSQLTRLRV